MNYEVNLRIRSTQTQSRPSSLNGTVTSIHFLLQLRPQTHTLVSPLLHAALNVNIFCERECSFLHLAVFERLPLVAAGSWGATQCDTDCFPVYAIDHALKCLIPGRWQGMLCDQFTQPTLLQKIMRRYLCQKCMLIRDSSRLNTSLAGQSAMPVFIPSWVGRASLSHLLLH